jgi:hypothetical protein
MAGRDVEVHTDLMKEWFHEDTMKVCKEVREVCGEDLEAVAEFVRG